MYNDEPMYCVLWCNLVYDDGLANFTVEPYQTYGPYDAEEAQRMLRIMREQHTDIGSHVKASFTVVPMSSWRV